MTPTTRDLAARIRATTAHVRSPEAVRELADTALELAEKTSAFLDEVYVAPDSLRAKLVRRYDTIIASPRDDATLALVDKARTDLIQEVITALDAIALRTINQEEP